MFEQLEFEETTIEIKELLLYLKKYIIIVILAGILAGAIGFFATKLFVMPIYEASSTMIVNTRIDQNVAVTNDQITSAENLVDTYAIIIQSGAVLNPVINALDLNESLSNLQNQVSVSAVNGTQVMRIAVKDPDPQRALKIVSQIVLTAPDIIIDIVEAGSVKTIDKPTVSSSPVSPNKKMNALLAAMLGIVVSAGIFVLKFMLDNTYKSELDIKKHLDLPVLGIIPSIESCGTKQGRTKK
jgi:capsular polysaccharide biosynthesis protein